MALMAADSPQRDELERRFTHHAPHGTQPERYAQLHREGQALAERIVTLTPISREQSLALTHLETAIFWANAAIARREPRGSA
jgi:hypothetical protein